MAGPVAEDELLEIVYSLLWVKQLQQQTRTTAARGVLHRKEPVKHAEADVLKSLQSPNLGFDEPAGLSQGSR